MAESPAQTRREWISRQIKQFSCFGLIGLANTGVDFGLTNLLVYLLEPRTAVGLFLIAVTSCGLATISSYFLNRRWTFSDALGQATPAEMARFFVVAGITLAVNTSTFLFAARFLPDVFPAAWAASLGIPYRYVIVNLAKLAGVAAAFMVSFLGYRLGVFKTGKLVDFRNSFRWERPIRDQGLLFQFAVLVAVGALARGGYAWLSATICGEAVDWAGAAALAAHGRWTEIPAGFLNLFTLWQAALLRLGFQTATSAVLSSWLPALALLLPVTWLARRLFNPAAGWLAGLFCIFHPRLMEYSTNGFEVSLFLLAFASAIAFLTAMTLRPRLLAAAGCGGAFAVCCSLQPETLLAVVLGSLAVLCWPAVRGSEQGTGAPPRAGTALAKAVLACWLVLGVALGFYAGLCQVAARQPVLRLAGFGLTAAHSPRLDPRAAARELYGQGAAVPPDTARPESTPAGMAEMARGISRNLFYNLERLPGILLTPAPLFALLLLLLLGRRVLFAPANLPLLLMLLFPLATYMLFGIEPRRLMPVLVPLQVFGAAGLLALSAYLRRDSRLPGLLPALVAVVLGLSVALSVWRGTDLEHQQQLHRDLAGWLARNVDRTTAITGCGYGFISTTGFLSGHPVVPRIWTGDPSQLQRFTDERGLRWLILYESFLRKANPELLPVLDGELPGFERVFEARDHAGFRAQVYRRVE